jgi:phosphoglycerate dehydrogenase-like enzyme
MLISGRRRVHRQPKAKEMPRMTTIGIIGSGNVGSNLAQAAIAHGYDAVLSNSRGPDSLAGLVAELGCPSGTRWPAW